ncbi:MoxR family ATPase, partial [bacterium]
ASPRTQSALLEAMEERQVSIDGATHPLPRPFFVVATQNPHEQLGTWPLPESQLDRFLMRIALGYPDAAEERVLLRESGERRRFARADAVLDGEAVLELQQRVQSLHVADALIDYVQRLVAATRVHPGLRLGLSPRAAQGLIGAARGWALLRGGEFVTPDDVQAVWAAVAEHRLDARDGTAGAPSLVRSVLESVAVPD